MEIAEWNELENRMNSQKGVNWMWCTLRMKGSWSYSRPFLQHCVAHTLRRLDTIVYGEVTRLEGKRLCRTAIFAQGLLPRRLNYYVLIIERPNFFEEDEFRRLINKCWSESIDELVWKLDERPVQIIGRVNLRSSFAVAAYEFDFENTHLPPSLWWDACDCDSCFKALAALDGVKNIPQQMGSSD